MQPKKTAKDIILYEEMDKRTFDAILSQGLAEAKKDCSIPIKEAFEEIARKTK